jgi:small subunit ribosomal protein S3
MGQKTHPLGFRLGIVKEHKSKWYADFTKYSGILQEDDKIRTYIDKIAKLSSISNIRINRNGQNNQIEICIETGEPGIVMGQGGNRLNELLISIKEILPSDREVTITVIEIERVDLDAALLADLVSKQLEKRIAFRRAIRDTLQRAQKQNVNGIKIQVSGRLNGAEMARSEWLREGRVPLQTLRADIDYATKEAHTIYGILGVKVWLFKSEILVK